jgi:enamine deaminase RidA (YjgF/YER057c/UK114 family)
MTCGFKSVNHVHRLTIPPTNKRRIALTRKFISSGSVFEEKVGYSRAVADGDYVFVAGTTGYDYTSMSISDDLLEQAEKCLQNIEKALLEAGSSLDDVVRVHYIFTDRLDFEPCWPILKKYLGNARPAATMFVADLVDERIKLEIEVTARLP